MSRGIKNISKLNEEEARLLEELKKIQEAKKVIEEGKKRETEGKPYITKSILEIFAEVTALLYSKKEQLEGSENTGDQLVAQFLESKIKEIDASIHSSINRASKKQIQRQFQKVLLKTLSLVSPRHLDEDESDAETDGEESIEDTNQEKIDELPKGPGMGVIWYLLTSFDLSKEVRIKELAKKIENRELTYGKIRPAQPQLLYAAKDIFDKISNMQTIDLAGNIEFSLDNKKITVHIRQLMKSFFKFSESNELLVGKDLKAIKGEEYAGPKSIGFFLLSLKVTLPVKDERPVLQASQESLVNLVDKLNRGDTNAQPEIRPEFQLVFGDRQINMEDEKSLIKGSSTTSNQLIHLLLRWFNSDIHPLAHLLVKTKIRKYDDGFIKNIELTHHEVDRLVVTNEISSLCVQSYNALAQFQKFVEYFCSLRKEPLLFDRYKVKILPLTGINIYTEDGCRLFLKRTMPLVGYKKSTTHIYSFFISFLNQAKGEKIAVNSVIPRLEEITTEKPTIILKQPSTVKSTVNNKSEFMSDRSPEVIEDYLSEQCKVNKIQELYNYIRSARSSEIDADDYKHRDIYLNDSRLKILELGKNNLVPSKDRVNAMAKYLFDMTRGQKNNNSILKMIKNNPKPINFAKELRLIIKK